MRQKFIEGTNKQYSIREDGTIINNKTKKELSKTNPIITIRVNGKRKSLKVKSLIHKYFGKYCSCGNKITTISSLCEDCIIIRDRNRWKKYKYNYTNKNYKRNYQKHKDIVRLSSIKKRKKLTKSYIADKLNISVKELSNELYELKKAQLQVKRALSHKTGKHIHAFN